MGDNNTSINLYGPLIAALSGCHRIHTHSWIGSFLVLLLNRKESGSVHSVLLQARLGLACEVQYMVFGQEEENVAPAACVCLFAL